MKLKLKRCKNSINGYLKLINGLLRFKIKYKTKMKISKMKITKMRSKQLILILILS